MKLTKTTLAALTLVSTAALAGGHGDHSGDDHNGHAEHHSHGQKGNVVFGVDFLNYSEEVDNLDLDITLLRGTLGYKYSFNKNLSILPEVFFGSGIDDDTVRVFGVDIENEIDSFYGFSFKAMYEFDEGLYGYVGPTYAKLDATASTNVGNSVRLTSSGSDSDWGFLGGLGYNFNEKWGAEFTYSDFGDDVTVAGVGLRFNLPN